MTKAMRSLLTCAALLAAIGCGGAAPERPERAALRPSHDLDPSGHLLTDVRQVSAGGAHTCALHADGRVTCWGDNRVGQLGDGSRTSSRVPVVVRALPPARWVAAGAQSTCAATLDGEVYCWGANSVGQLGNGEQANGYTMPVRVVGVEGANGAESSNDAERSCAILDGGSIACWGRLASQGDDGRPILGSVRPERDPAVHGVIAAAIGQSHECVLTESGDVLCRGYGPNGELGTRSTEVERAFVRVPGLDGVVAVAAGARHTCAVRTNGSAWCWGDNGSGQLGTGGRSSFHAPVRVALPAPVRAIAAGDAHTCALGEHGNVYCWGDNSSGQLGDGSTRAAVSPEVVRMREQVLDLTAGARHTCVVVAGGDVRCWGDNVAGQLGDGTEHNRRWPVAVLDPLAPGESRPVVAGADVPVSSPVLE